MSDSDKEPLQGDVMDVEGVAEYLGLAPSTIYDKVRDLEMPHTRLGNLIRFRKVDVDRWLGENTVYPHPTLQTALSQAVERFFYEHWLHSVGLDLEKSTREEALKALQDSIARFTPTTEEAP